MVGHRFWKAHFGGDASAIGRTIQIGAERRTILGVLPPEADRFPAGGADLWMVLTFPPSSFLLNQRGSIALAAIGRLRGGTTLAAAQDEDRNNRGAAGIDVSRHEPRPCRTSRSAAGGDGRPDQADDAAVLGLSVAMLLAVACANIANLLLAEAHARTREFATRGALGAAPSRIARQMWTETLGFFGVAGGLGVAIAQPLASWLVARYPGTLPLAADAAADGGVLAVAAASTLAAALLAGLPRVRRRRDADPGSELRGDARAGLTRGHRRMTTLFVAAQISMSIVLVFGGLVLLRTFVNLISTAPGFEADGVIAIRASIPPVPGGDARRCRGPPGPAARRRPLVARRDRRGARDVHPICAGLVG